MPPSPRPYRLVVKLTEAERAILDERAKAEGTSRAAVLRSVLTTPPSDAAASPATREQALAILERSARDGSVPAQVALVRELRLRPLHPLATEPQMEVNPFAEFVDELAGRRLG